MGVPAFFRWLTRKYPSVIVHCVEEKAKVVDGTKVPVDSSKPNPNNVEFDNLYLDMNGIIHPCCHPENKPAPKDENEMMIAIFEYIDRIFSIVRPRRLLYMAIDGVAPRAKMNQQRSRRFRAAKESGEKSEEITNIREHLMSVGAILPPEKAKGEHFDSNCITPGTPFMARLANCLHYYIHDRLNNDPGWKKIEVILSDANVPGEGEHKIMDFIRRQRANPEYDQNTRHCLCGADADLIMLGLATHEPNFTIIREEFKPNQPRPCDICGVLGHEMKECTGASKVPEGQFDELGKSLELDVEFLFVRLNVLREYLAKELHMPNLPFPYDFERTVDDWLLMCFFVGNDFLPHLPSLEIREGAIDRLVQLYRSTVYKTGGYLTDSGEINLTRVQLIMTDLGEVEDEIFKRRQDNEVSFRQRQKDRKKRMKMGSDKPAWTPGGQFRPQAVSKNPAPVHDARREAYQMRMMSTASSKDALSAMLKSGEAESDVSSSNSNLKRKIEDADSDEEPQDDVRLWEEGWKDRYYEVKFDVAKDNYEFRHKVAAAYVEGLCWVLKYYYQGCSSWKWFFPYHYAPFASDFLNIGDLKIDFTQDTEPCKPLEQLMGVFPAASRQHVPETWGSLMTDVDSPIIDFYPTNFKIDLNGKKFAWQGVALLPFVNERRLMKALEKVYPLLTEAEIRRNTRGSDRLYVRKGHTAYDYMASLYETSNADEINLSPKLFFGMQGTIKASDDVVLLNECLASPIPSLQHISKNMAICVKFADPQYQKKFVFPAVRLPKAIDPPRVLRPDDMPLADQNGWRAMAGMVRSSRRAYVDPSGHRAINHSMRGNSRYDQVPPPSNFRGGRSYQSYNHPSRAVASDPYSGRMYQSQQYEQPPNFQHHQSYQRNNQNFRRDNSYWGPPQNYQQRPFRGHSFVPPPWNQPSSNRREDNRQRRDYLPSNASYSSYGHY